MEIYKGGILNDFIGGGLRQNVIPVYQRNYEWTDTQCKKLFEDILTAHRAGKEHFCGSLIDTFLKKEKKIDYYVIVDGQQRLTTVYLLLKALMDNADDEEERKMLQQPLFNQDPFKKYHVAEESKLKLKPVKSDNEQLLLIMAGKFAEADADTRIYQNYHVFCRLIQDARKKDSELTVANIYHGIQLLTCAVINLGGEDSAQEIFECINSTGVPLSLADKIRNFVLMTDENQEALYETYWLELERTIPADTMTKFFVDYLNFKREGFTTENKAYEDFKELFQKKRYTHESMLAELLHYGKQYSTFCCDDDEDLSAEINQALTDLLDLKQTTVYLFLFPVFDDYEEGVINQKTLAEVLRLLVIYSVRRLVCGSPSNSLRSFYKTLYRRVFARKENKQFYYDSIVSYLLQIHSVNQMPSKKEFLHDVQNIELYRNRQLCRFLLEALENQGKEKINLDGLTIEHILPQNKHLSKAWQEMLGPDWEETQRRYLHTLGNLTLTGYNGELSDMPFSEKRKLLKESVTHVNVLYEDLRYKKKWDAAAIEGRAEHLAKSLARILAIKKPKEKIEFKDDRYQLYSGLEADEATNKQLDYYELFDEQVDVSRYSDMLLSVMRHLYDRNPTLIEAWAKENKIFKYCQEPLFSCDAEEIYHPTLLREGKELYVRCRGFSAKTSILIIATLLEEYGLDPEEDFHFSARAYEQSEAD